MPRFRIFQNDVPTINAGDLIRNKKNKEIYSGVKNAVDNNQMTSEGYTFDSGGCLRSAPSYDAFLALTRGWSLGSIRYEDISNISTSIASDFADPGAAWAQRYNTINLTDYDIVRDASLNSVHNTGGKYAINVIHRDISSVEMNHFLTGSTIKPKTKYSALNPAYSASIQLDPSNILYSTGCSAKSINNNDDAKWKQLVSTQQSSEQYRNNIYRIVKNTDWQFSYPRKFNIKQSRISNNIIPNSTGFTQTIFASGGTITTYTSDGKNYKVHTFLTSGTFTSTAATTGGSLEILVVAGGGSGGSVTGYGGFTGGGGAGQVYFNNDYTVYTSTYSIVIGGGGQGYTNTGNGGNTTLTGTNSNDSVLTVIGGGVGGNSLAGGVGYTGGSGGGSCSGHQGAQNPSRVRGSRWTTAPNASTTGGDFGTPNTTLNQVGRFGSDGGAGSPGGDGGGGAGEVGESANTVNNIHNGRGGDGKPYDIRYGPSGSTNHKDSEGNNLTLPSGWDGDERYYGGGGGGVRSNTHPRSLGGGGKGIKKGKHRSEVTADNVLEDSNIGLYSVDGKPNTGGGGGGLNDSQGALGGYGGSGIVIIRYQVS